MTLPTSPKGVGKEATGIESFDLYLAISGGGDASCTFGAVTGCQLFKLPTTLARSDTGEVDVTFSVEGLVEILPGVPAAMPSPSPSGDRLAFMVTSETAALSFRGIYLYDLNAEVLSPLTAGQTHNGRGTWPRWASDREVVFSNTNACPERTGPGCNRDSRYQDVLISDIGVGALETAIVVGDVHPSTNLDTRACSAEDPAPNGTHPDRIGFHSTLVDGNTNAVERCPWLAGVTIPQPQPVVMDVGAAPPDGQLASLKAGVDYWPFDLAAAGIHGCAHLDFGPQDRVVVCSEQTASSDAYFECSIIGVALASCRERGGYAIKFSRVFGFTQDGTHYRNLHENDPTAPLFVHRHPSELPNAERFWRDDVLCANYNTKYVELASESTLLASVLCVEETNGRTAFSRVMLIDITDPVYPDYVDVTGWFEDQFPERWPSGTATGFTGAFGAR